MNKVKFYNKAMLRNKANKFLLKHYPIALEKPTIIDIDELIELKLQIALEFQNIDYKNEILGMFVFYDTEIDVYNNYEKQKIHINKNTIVINTKLISDLSNEGRYRFTCAHEIGHYVLHSDMFYIDEDQLSFFDSEKLDKMISCDDNNKLYRKDMNELEIVEWQANYFASEILMPYEIFNKEYNILKKQFADLEIIKKLSEIFGVSKQAVEIKIKDNKADFVKEQVTFDF